ncbi:hypothetical protein LY78DRAFT_676856 [Colletotrichum sublineola]|nr:hypothetical protein LY78DRAFT_676856 [Colletotrichum sublineola]
MSQRLSRISNLKRKSAMVHPTLYTILGWIFVWLATGSAVPNSEALGQSDDTEAAGS